MPIAPLRIYIYIYRGADKSLARPERKQANVLSEWREFPSALSLAGKKKLDISRLDVVEIARVAWHAFELVSFLVGLRTYQHPGILLVLLLHFPLITGDNSKNNGKAYGRLLLASLWSVRQDTSDTAVISVHKIMGEFSCRACRSSLLLTNNFFPNVTKIGTTNMNEVPYLLTPWCRVLLEKLTGLQLVKKFPVIHGTRRFIPALTSVRHLSLSWASPIQSIYPHPTSWRSILILSTHLRLGPPSGLFPPDFPTKTLYTPSPHPYVPHAQPISFFYILSVVSEFIEVRSVSLDFFSTDGRTWVW